MVATRAVNTLGLRSIQTTTIILNSRISLNKDREGNGEILQAVINTEEEILAD